MRFICFPSRAWHAYQAEFARAIKPHGIDIVQGDDFTNHRLRQLAPGLAGIHFHFIHNMWLGPNPLASIKLLMGIDGYCRLAHRLGLRIVWTVHDLTRHGGPRWIDPRGFRTIARHADLVIVHSDLAGNIVRDRYRPRGRMIRMPHGNFDSVLQPRLTPDQTRAALGLLPTDAVVGVIGSLKPYRAHDRAIEAARLLGPKVKLLIAGSGSDADYARQVRAWAADAPNVVCRLENLDDAAYAQAIAACDAILLPYHEITGSGALLAAWTQSVPVVMSKLPFFEEFAPQNPAAGLVMDENTPAGLARTIERLLAFPAEVRRGAAAEENRKYDWNRLVVPVAQAFHAMMAAGKPAPDPTQRAAP